jgi:Protein of unknown function (DUF2997)
MQEHKIKIVIDENGKVSAETLGIEGEDCLDELNELLAELMQLEQVKKKPEYHKKSQKSTSTKVQNK